jgi:hypothetical protein
LTLVLVVALALSGCARAKATTFRSSPGKGIAAAFCAALTNPNSPGTTKFVEVPAATVSRDYGHYRGVSGFVRSVGSGSVVFCSLDHPAPSLRGCRQGRTMFLLTSDRHKFELPCGAQPGRPR